METNTIEATLRAEASAKLKAEVERAIQTLRNLGGRLYDDTFITPPQPQGQPAATPVRLAVVLDMVQATLIHHNDQARGDQAVKHFLDEVKEFRQRLNSLEDGRDE